MKEPHECENMMDIRQEIDHLDHQIIGLLGCRFTYVKAAARFKTDETSVKVPERLKTMLVQRRAWAEEAGLDPDVIEKMYQDLVNYFITREIKEWTNHTNK